MKTKYTSLPVIPGQWLPGSFNKRIYGLKHEIRDREGMVYHTGTDIKMYTGDPVMAIADGEVVYATNDYRNSLGRVVVIRHEFDDGIFFSIYGHLRQQKDIESFDKKTKQWIKVKRGQLVGLVGTEQENGRYGTHLHFGVTKGEAFLDKNGNYEWSFFGYGLLENELNLSSHTLADKIRVYATLERIGGNSIDPVQFVESRLIGPDTTMTPGLIKRFTIDSIAPGGERYEWITKKYPVPENGKYIVRVTGSAKNGKQNYPRRSKGDADNLWPVFNGYDLLPLKQDVSLEALSLKGSLLKGHTQEINYIFDISDTGRMNRLLSWLVSNDQRLTLFADETPTLEKIEVFAWSREDLIQFDYFEQPQPNDGYGVPWKSYVLFTKPKEILVRVRCLSALMRKSTDDDGLKLVSNHSIVKHLLYQEVDKYKNWPLSGDQDKGAVRELSIKSFSNRPWNALTLWADNRPTLERVVLKF